MVECTNRTNGGIVDPARASFGRIGIALTSLVAAALMGLGCGGSSGSSTAGSSQIVTPTISFNNKVVAPVSQADRTTAEAALDATWTSMMGKGPTTIAAALVAQMKSMKVFRLGGTSDQGDCWGEFTDGVIISYGTFDPGVNSTPLPAAVKKGPVKPAIAQFPGSNRAYIFDPMELARGTNSQLTASNLSNYGYNATVKGGSFDDWASINNGAIIYSFGHGTVALVETGSLFEQEVADLETPALDLQYDSALKQHQIVLFPVEVIGDDGTVTIAHHYGLTQFWSGWSGVTFAPDSLFINEACEGGADTQPNGYIQFLLKKGLGVYAGWTSEALQTDTVLTGAMILDRSLALYLMNPVDTTKSGPQDWQSLSKLLPTLERPGGSYAFDTTQHILVKPNGKGELVTGKFVFTPGTTNLGTIIPAIQKGALSTDGSQYVLTGVFGNATGTAAQGTNSLTVISWSPTQVVLATPTNLGPIQLNVAGILSNPFDFENLKLTPATATITAGGRQTFQVTPPPGFTGVQYSWDQNSANGTLSSSSGIVKNHGLTTTDTSVDLVTTPSDQGAVTVTVEAFVVASGVNQVVGRGKATVTLSSSLTVQSSLQFLVFPHTPTPENTYFAVDVPLVEFTPLPGIANYTIYQGNGGTSQILPIHVTITNGVPVASTVDPFVVSGPTTYNYPETQPGNPDQFAYCFNLGNGVVGFFPNGVGYISAPQTVAQDQAVVTALYGGSYVRVVANP